LALNNNHLFTIYISVSVKGDNGRQFKGTQIAAHRSQGDIEEFLGEFTEYPTDKMKTLNCIGGKRVGELSYIRSYRFTLKSICIFCVTECSFTHKNVYNFVLYIS